MTPAASTPAEQARRASFHRGRVFTGIVVVVTALAYLVPAAADLLSGHPEHNLPAFFTGPVLGSLVCWAALRGGALSTGCLSVGYTLFLAIAALGVGLVAASYGAPWLFPDASAAMAEKFNWSDPRAAILLLLPVLALLGWFAFAFWVLLLSRDARFYREWRRRGVFAAADPSFADWRPGLPK